MQTTTTSEFQGTPRFRVRRRLGAGGFGVVYEAFDQERGAVVALKTLARMSAGGIYGLKQEFRALADVTHPNLVALHELVSTAGHWFFTMELVDGVDYLSHVRASASAAPASGVATIDESDTTMESSKIKRVAFRPRPALQPAAHPGRVRATLPQLVEGLAALHAAGKLHRDVKPSNVMVSSAGRVVLLDFGLVREQAAPAVAVATVAADQDDALIVGTPEYMSPEQGIGEATTPASDWYSVGVILFEALTGRLPFEGNFTAMATQRRLVEAPRPSALTSHVPSDLEALCVRLLRRDPTARPPIAEITRAVGATGGGYVTFTLDSPEAASGLVGREAALAALDAAAAAVRGGTVVVVEIWGPSGVGKSHLVQHFLAGLGARRGAVVLAGRCYERESVPFKAVDSLVDALTTHLRSLPDADVAELLPADIGVLAPLFPVLRRVPAIETAAAEAVVLADQQEVRRRAFGALKTLLARMAKLRPLVLAVDDMQWSDEDSAALWRDVLAPPDAPGLLFLASYRGHAPPARSFVDTVPDRPGAPAALVRARVAVTALTPAEAEDLARALLGRGAADGVDTARIARESAGNPFFVGELVRYLRAGYANPENVSLAGVIHARVAALLPGVRRLLDVIALVGQPVAQRAVFAASGLGAEAYPALAALRAASLVRTDGARATDAVEAYHDRIRETVVAALAPDATVELHRRIAAALEALGTADPSMLATHYAGAGDRARAGQYAVAAAEQADRALAFDRAARLYRAALEHLAGTPAADVGLRTRLGAALVHAGRGSDAAAVYLQAAGEAPGATALELRRRAAEALLLNGSHAEGLAVLQTVLRGAGLELPATPRRAQLALLVAIARLTVRGLGFRERPAHAIDPAVLRRIDVCQSAGLGTAFSDSILSFGFLTQFTLQALQAGEPTRVAVALARYACTLAATSVASGRRGQALLDTAAALADRADSPPLRGLVALSRGFANFTAGRFRDSLADLRAAERILERTPGDTFSDLDMCRNMLPGVLYNLGELDEWSRRSAALYQDMRDRGALHGRVLARVRLSSLQRLVADDPEGAEREITGAMAEWPHGGFLQINLQEMTARAQVLLYCGRGREAHAVLAERWRALERSLMLRAQFFRIDAVFTRASCAIAAAADGGPRGRLLAAAERDAARLAGEDAPWGQAYAPLVRAGVASVRGDRARAVGEYRVAAAALAANEMVLCAAAARTRLGALLGGAEGAALGADAAGFLREAGVKNPARWAEMYAPGAPGVR